MKFYKNNIKHPMVLIIGAGASKGVFDNEDIPPPVDAEFFEMAKRITGNGTERLVRTVLHNIFELYGKTYNVGLEKYYADIEARRDVSAIAPKPKRRYEWGKRINALVELIRRVYIHTTTELRQGLRYHKKASYYDKIFDLLSVNEDSIISFNYDLVIEEALPRTIWNPKTGYGISISNIQGWHYKLEQEQNSLKLLKLHGSINWNKMQGGGMRLHSKRYYMAPRGYKPRKEKFDILPPGMHKTIDRQPYTDLWKNAGKVLNECKALIFIGYSMPDTDMLAKSLFLETVRWRGAKNGLSNIVIVNPDKEVQSKLLNLFAPIIGTRCKIYKYDTVKDFYDAIT